MSMQHLLNAFFNKAHAEFGEYWASEFRRSYRLRDQTRDNYQYSNWIDYPIVESFLNEFGLKVTGWGASRLVFEYKNVVVKVNHADDPGNEKEYVAYRKCCESKYVKYLVCPIIENLEVDGQNVLVSFKTKVLDFKDYTPIQKSIYGIIMDLIDDAHPMNTGAMLNGLVSIDLNWGYRSVYENLAEHFAKVNKDFWKTYTADFDSLINSIRINTPNDYVDIKEVVLQ